MRRITTAKKEEAGGHQRCRRMQTQPFAKPERHRGGKKQKRTLKHCFQTLPTSCRDNVLSLVNGYVVYQEGKTKQAQKEDRQTPGLAAVKVNHTSFCLPKSQPDMQHTLLSDFTTLKVTSNPFRSPTPTLHVKLTEN